MMSRDGGTTNPIFLDLVSRLLTADKIGDFCEFSKKFHMRLHNSPSSWLCRLYRVEGDEGIIQYWSLYRIVDSIQSRPRMISALKIFSDLHVEIYTESDGRILGEPLSSTFDDQLHPTLVYWSQFTSLVSQCSSGKWVDCGNHEHQSVVISDLHWISYEDEETKGFHALSTAISSQETCLESENNGTNTNSGGDNVETTTVRGGTDLLGAAKHRNEMVKKMNSLQDLARIDLDLLSLSVNTDGNKEGREELEKVFRLVQVIMNEGEISFYRDVALPEESNEDEGPKSYLPLETSSQLLPSDEGTDYGAGGEDCDGDDDTGNDNDGGCAGIDGKDELETTDTNLPPDFIIFLETHERVKEDKGIPRTHEAVKGDNCIQRTHERVKEDKGIPRTHEAVKGDNCIQQAHEGVKEDNCIPQSVHRIDSHDKLIETDSVIRDVVDLEFCLRTDIDDEQDKDGSEQHKTENVRQSCKTLIQCTACDERLDTYILFRSHCDDKHPSYEGLVPFHRLICDEKFDIGHHSESKRKKGKKIKLNPVPCQLCGKIYQPHTITGHEARVHNIKHPTQCSLCGKECNSTALLKIHMIYRHLDERRFQCSECGKMFKTADGLKRHTRYTHADTGNFVCFVCNKRYRTPFALSQHKKHPLHQKIKSRVENNLSNGTGYDCSSCDKSFDSIADLNTHMKSHQSYECRKCGQACKTLFQYHEHLLYHSGTGNTGNVKQKPLQCKVCHKVFKTQRTFKKHSIVHTDEFPYQCSLCGKKFKWVVGFQNHERMHQGVKPFKCDTCGKGFVSNGRLTSHQLCHQEGKFKCDVCHKVYKEQCKFRKHQMKHSAE